MAHSWLYRGICIGSLSGASCNTTEPALNAIACTVALSSFRNVESLIISHHNDNKQRARAPHPWADCAPAQRAQPLWWWRVIPNNSCSIAYACSFAHQSMSWTFPTPQKIDRSVPELTDQQHLQYVIIIYLKEPPKLILALNFFLLRDFANEKTNFKFWNHNIIFEKLN